MKKLLLVFALLLVLCLPIAAQDAEPVLTVEANPVTVIDGEGATTVEDGGVNVVIEAPVTPVESVDPAEPWYAKYAAGLLALFVTVSGILYGGIQGLNKWLEGRKADAASMTLAESGYARSPGLLKRFIVGMIKEFIRLGGNLQEILSEVEDETPFAAKQILPKPTTSQTPGGYTQTTPPMP